jgi:hypothetical protein
MANTSKGTPYVEPGDNVADYPTVSKALADHIDTVTPKGRASGANTTAASGAVAVTFPVGVFTTAPRVALSMNPSQLPSVVWAAYATGITAAGMTLRGHRSDALGGSVMGITWIAEEA